MDSIEPAVFRISDAESHNVTQVDAYIDLVRNASVPTLVPLTSSPPNDFSPALTTPLLFQPIIPSNVPKVNQLRPQVNLVPVGRSRPLSDGPLGWTYVSVSARPHQSLESFLPPSDYARRNTSLLSLVMTSCEPEEQVITATPGAEHAMAIENKSKHRIVRFMKSVKKVRHFFKRGLT